MAQKREIINPFTTIKGYNCFGCSPQNPFGLKLNFVDEGDSISCRWQPKDEFQGYFDILHGGIQAALIDETACWLLFTKVGKGGFTTKLNIDYKKSVYTNRGEITLRAYYDRTEKNIVFVKVELYNSSDELCSTAEASFFTLPDRIAKTKMHYPGVDAFYKKELS